MYVYILKYRLSGTLGKYFFFPVEEMVLVNLGKSNLLSVVLKNITNTNR